MWNIIKTIKGYSLSIKATCQAELDIEREFLKRIDIYTSDQGFASIKDSQIGELLEWSSHEKKDIALSDSARLAYESYLSDTFSQTVKIRRGRVSDHDLLELLSNEYTYNEIQLHGIKAMLSRSAFLNADEQGMGKTLMLIAVLSYLMKHDKLDGVLLLAMNGLPYHFYYEILKFSTYIQEQDMFVVDKTMRFDLFNHLDSSKKIAIIPHHLFHECLYYADGKEKTRSFAKKRWSDCIPDIKALWGKEKIALCVDESQQFKNNKAIQTKALLEFSKQCDYRYLTSATPNINYFYDIYTQARVLDPSIIPMDYNAFLVFVSKSIGSKFSARHVRQFDERKVQMVKESLDPFVLKRLKSDVDGFNWQIKDQVKYFKMTPVQAKLYIEIRQNELLSVKKADGKVSLSNIAHRFPYTLQVLENVMLLNEKLESQDLAKLVKKWKFDDDPRVAFLDGFLDDYINNQNKKVVIFDSHPLTIDLLCERYSKYKPLKIHGSMSTRETKDKASYRKEVERKFNESSDNQLAVLSTYTSRAGISLNRGSDCIIFYNPPLNSEHAAQAKERIHRINNDRDSLVINLLFYGTFHVMQYKRNKDSDNFNQRFLTRDLSDKEIDQLLNGDMF